MSLKNVKIDLQTFNLNLFKDFNKIIYSTYYTRIMVLNKYTNI